ncbi:MAG: glycosyltransferase family 39 protein [Candidatus Omnitrophica bacterium]|nr:glycosyltransferase family 39 protein [Candidatus Omnitrophota bacterium]
MFLFLEKYRHVFIIIAAVVLFTHTNCFHNNFVLDDRSVLLYDDNLSRTPVLDILAKPYKGFYRPFNHLVIKSMMPLLQGFPALYHGFNIIIFSFMVFLFYIIILKLTGQTFLALLSCLLYAVHPLNTVYIALKTGGFLCQYVIFMQLSFIFFLRYLKQDERRHFFLSLIFFTCSLFTHEISFLLPVYLFLGMYFSGEKSLKKKIVLLFPYIIPVIIFITARFAVLGMQFVGTYKIADAAQLPITFHQYITTIIKLAGWYVRQIFYPHDILFVWDERVPLHPNLWVTVITLTAVSGIVFWSFFKKRSVVGFGLTLFLAGFSILFVGSFIYYHKTRMAFIEPHWLHFNLIGAFIVISYYFLQIKKVMNGQLWKVIMLGIFLVLGMYTINHNHVWRDEEVYSTYWMQKNALNGVPWENKAREYISRKKYLLNFPESLTCNSACQLAMAYIIRRDGIAAASIYRRAIDQFPDCAHPFYGFSVLMHRAQDCQGSRIFLQKAKDMDPGLYPAYKIIFDAMENKHGKDAVRKVSAMLGVDKN